MDVDDARHIPLREVISPLLLKPQPGSGMINNQSVGNVIRIDTHTMGAQDFMDQVGIMADNRKAVESKIGNLYVLDERETSGM
jgi:hypothetical protein